MKTLSWALIAVGLLLLPGGIAATTPVDLLPAWQPRTGGDLAFEASAFAPPCGRSRIAGWRG